MLVMTVPLQFIAGLKAKSKSTQLQTRIKILEKDKKTQTKSQLRMRENKSQKARTLKNHKIKSYHNLKPNKAYQRNLYRKMKQEFK